MHVANFTIVYVCVPVCMYMLVLCLSTGNTITQHTNCMIAGTQTIIKVDRFIQIHVIRISSNFAFELCMCDFFSSLFWMSALIFYFRFSILFI